MEKQIFISVGVVSLNGQEFDKQEVLCIDSGSYFTSGRLKDALIFNDVQSAIYCVDRIMTAKDTVMSDGTIQAPTDLYGICGLCYKNQNVTITMSVIVYDVFENKSKSVYTRIAEVRRVSENGKPCVVQLYCTTNLELSKSI